MLISDLQRSALHGLSRFAVDEGVELVIEPVGAAVARNAAILSARLEGDERQGYALVFELRNTGQAALPAIDTTLEVDGRVVGATDRNWARRPSARRRRRRLPPMSLPSYPSVASVGLRAAPGPYRWTSS